jgi:hypothetical protein
MARLARGSSPGVCLVTGHHGKGQSHGALLYNGRIKPDKELTMTDTEHFHNLKRGGIPRQPAEGLSARVFPAST